jgi:tRNA modification GTPase
VFSTTDSIVAIATPPGRGGVGVVRLSGPAARDIAGRLITSRAPLEPRLATLTFVGARPGADRRAIDQVVATFFPAPASYTGEDVVELSAHGSPLVLGSIVAAAIDAGARLAEPGEFTLRAYLNGKLDLMQAEAVLDLVEAVTPLQARVAFDQLQGTLTRAIGELDATLFDVIAQLEASVDFPEEGYHFAEPESLASTLERLVARTGALLAGARRGRLVREGLQIAIVGRPNVGKSTLFNALVGSDRAIVTEVAGTTRDLITETIDVGGLRVRVVDTAGVRDSDDPIELEGVSRSRRAASVSDLILIVVDGSVDPDPRGDSSEEFLSRRHLVVVTKSDLPARRPLDHNVWVCARTGAGLTRLRERIAEALDFEPLHDAPEITNVRHSVLVERAHVALQRAHSAVAHGPLSEEFVLADLQEARAALEEITGKRAPDAVIAHIFERFCIGK